MIITLIINCDDDDADYHLQDEGGDVDRYDDGDETNNCIILSSAKMSSKKRVRALNESLAHFKVEGILKIVPYMVKMVWVINDSTV